LELFANDAFLTQRSAQSSTGDITGRCSSNPESLYQPIIVPPQE
jgi:hypothetical protein